MASLCLTQSRMQHPREAQAAVCCRQNCCNIYQSLLIIILDNVETKLYHSFERAGTAVIWSIFKENQNPRVHHESMATAEQYCFPYSPHRVRHCYDPYLCEPGFVWRQEGDAAAIRGGRRPEARRGGHAAREPREAALRNGSRRQRAP